MKYGDYALQFDTVYYVLSADYNIYMDIQQEIYLAIHEAFAQESITSPIRPRRCTSHKVRDSDPRVRHLQAACKHRDRFFPMEKFSQALRMTAGFYSGNGWESKMSLTTVVPVMARVVGCRRPGGMRRAQ
jgi:hypothetical protein